MADRAYTVKEIDDLRRACDDRYLFGSCVYYGNGPRVSHSYSERDKAVAVEQMVRAYMISGHIAQDLIDEDTRKAEAWRSS